VKREILISATAQETRVAILEDDILVELMADRPDNERIVGDIYLGQVQAVLPGIDAAFVDINQARLPPRLRRRQDAAGDEDEDEGGGDRGSKRFPPIQELVEKGQRLLVQPPKEPIGARARGHHPHLHRGVPGLHARQQARGRQPQDRGSGGATAAGPSPGSGARGRRCHHPTVGES
jgi:ribonuclease G